MNKLSYKLVNSVKLKIIKDKLAKGLALINDLIIKMQLFVDYIVSPQKVNQSQFLIISASDTSHFKSLCQLLDSLCKYCVNDKVLVYDLGLKNQEIDYIKKTYKEVDIKYFDFSAYPSFINLKEKDAGAYAWKPLIIYNERQLSNLPIIWMDAGNLVLRKIDLLKRHIINKNFYSPYSSDTLVRWTHPATLDKLKVSSELLKKRNKNAALVAFNNDDLSNNFIFEWKNLAIQKDIIIPSGSNKSNHRWDQSLLTILYYQMLNIKLGAKTYKFWGIKIHQDID